MKRQTQVPMYGGHQSKMYIHAIIVIGCTDLRLISSYAFFYVRIYTRIYMRIYTHVKL